MTMQALPSPSLSDDDLARDVADDLNAALARALTRLLSSAAAADQALAEGACMLGGGTLAWQLDPDTLVVGLFCDVGLPQVADAPSAYRIALEANLCRNYPGVYIGVHPQSERLVATMDVPAVLLFEDDYCVQVLETLASHARHLREEGGLSLQADSTTAQA